MLKIRISLILVSLCVFLWSCKTYPSADKEAKRISTIFGSMLFNNADRELRMAFLPFESSFGLPSDSAEVEAGKKMRQLLFDSVQKYLEDNSLSHYLIPLDEVDRIYNELSRAGEVPARPSGASLKDELDADILLLGDLAREDEMEGVGYYHGKSTIINDNGNNKELRWKFRYLTEEDNISVLWHSLWNLF